ncbi:Flavonol 4'-sulfotransferase [Hibiscus syriacus]|uniref:Sulfotransferase n=1 Tax=Hibiscus syriacus TaxID=106335 RepID=A0A6A3ADP7_HIBSY|nr:Flavonol 4'-sulfotransferase [Hibiscus syriacus]
MYHFYAELATSRNMERIPLDQAFEFFCDGASSSGPYWDHVLGYWKASLDQPDRILFLKYEDMKENTAFYTRKLAEFIGYGFTLEEEGKGVVGKIVRMCSFDYLRNLEVNKSGKVGENTPWEMENKVFYRKSTVKDWENYLTPEMAAHMDFITQQKLSDSGLNLIYVVEVLIIRALKWHGQVPREIKALMVMKKTAFSLPFPDERSAPKTGTTWLKALAVAVVSRTTVDDDSTAGAFVSKSPHECLPASEYSETSTPFDRDTRNPLISTHIPIYPIYSL